MGDYFLKDAALLAPSWALGILVMWVVVAIGAALWMRSLPPKNAARLAFRKRTATGLLMIAGLGILQMVTRIFLVPVISWRLWSYVIFLAGIIFAAIVYRDSRANLPQRAANSGRVQRTIGSRRPGTVATPGTDAPAVPAEPRPIALTGRRDARRSKKKKR